MKSLFPFILLCLSEFFAYGQGTVNFNNKISSAGIDAPVFYLVNSPSGPISVPVDGALHPGARTALYAGPDGATEDQLVLIAPAVGFRSGIAAGYVSVGLDGQRDIPSVGLGAFAIVQVRAWDTSDGAVAASYEEASRVSGAYVGSSALLRIKTGGDTPPGSPIPNFPANLDGLQGFYLAQVPEPGSIFLLALGLLFPIFLRRNKT